MNTIDHKYYHDTFWPMSKWEKHPEYQHEFLKTVMGISEAHKFISILIAKSAGTSIRRGVFEKNIKDYIICPDLPKPIYEWDDYFKFTIMRDPWERFVSCYTYFSETNADKRIPEGTSFKDFCLKYAWDDNGDPINCHWLPQYFYIRDDSGRWWVDFIARLDNIEEGFKVICDEIGISYDIPHLNKSKHDNYKRYYADR